MKWAYPIIFVFCISLASAQTPYFQDNFDNGQKNPDNGFGWGGQPIVNDTAYSGDYSMRFRYGPDAPGEDSWQEERFRMSSQNEVWIEYMLRIPDNFIHREEYPNNNKFIYLGGDYSDGLTFLTEYVRGNDTESKAKMVSIADEYTDSGELIRDRENNPTQNTMITAAMRSTWVRIRTHAKVASGPEQYDGVWEGWIDDSLAWRSGDWVFWEKDGTNEIIEGYLLGWSNSGYTEQTDFYIDDFKLWTTNPGWGTTTTPSENPGDLNQDGKVNIQDITIVAQNIGRTTNYDTRADINQDQQINVFDIVLVAKHFGTNYTTCTPTTEVCDGADNDCDSEIDEGVTNACGTCGPTPTETCGDNIDNNCDGQVDEGCDTQTSGEGEMIAAWPFDEGSGTTSNDIINNNQATLHNGVSWTQGRYGTGLLFDGTDDWIELPKVIDTVNDQHWTFSTWFQLHRLASETNDIEIFKYTDTSGQADTYIYLDNDDIIKAYESQGDRKLSTGVAVQTNTWHHVAGVRNGTNYKIYVDGIEEVSSNYAFTTTGDTYEIFKADTRSWGQGLIDEIRFYNKTLTREEIQQAMNEALTNASGGCNCNYVACEPGNTGMRCNGCTLETAPAETCDGTDNDCDGTTDEGVTNTCGTCGPTPNEICQDSIDNDCDGTTDETECTDNTPYFQDNFDNGQKNPTNGWRWGGEPIVNTHSYSGNYSMQFLYNSTPEDTHVWSEERFRITDDPATAPTEVWIEYMLRIPDNWQQRDGPSSDNNKLLAIWSESYHESTTSTLVVYEFVRDGGLSDPSRGSNLRIASAMADDCEPRYPDAVQYWGGHVINASMRGEWIRIRTHLKSEVDASIADVWRDNTLIASLPSDYSITCPSWENNHFRHGYLMGWDNSGYNEETIYYIDDFKLWTTDPQWTFS